MNQNQIEENSEDDEISDVTEDIYSDPSSEKSQQSIIYSNEVEQKPQKSRELSYNQKKIDDPLEIQNNSLEIDQNDFLRDNQKLQQNINKNNVVQNLIYDENDDFELKMSESIAQYSRLLIINQSKTKIKRKIPFKIENIEELKKDIDERKIYVENLPQQIQLEDLQIMFQKVGPVLHIELPKKKKSKGCKGYAFIEYQTKQQAIEAQQYFNNFLPKKIVELANGAQTQALKVLTKLEWLQEKKEFQHLNQVMCRIFNE
ncbi:hypothetical protein PPERSA_05704 [Pseudocohnilembus persalinus]|uniref:RRM domain-containing protein n=1 Tax=Pseudocohnilembus persalinus TaxID=266149 RepID=A0A0V0QM67_PSEPJ|nr:hypothetical protein PPERSA_05704 [Pseudocohnilembus persalinus]|eukprot:KRX03346.1 hypothetical protein PPERSA_05704 [Pseudocohnilembus persalinus]